MRSFEVALRNQSLATWAPATSQLRFRRRMRVRGHRMFWLLFFTLFVDGCGSSEPPKDGAGDSSPPASVVDVDLSGPGPLFRHEGREERGILTLRDDRSIVLRVQAPAPCTATLGPSGASTDVGPAAVTSITFPPRVYRTITIAGAECPVRGVFVMTYQDQASFCDWAQLRARPNAEESGAKYYRILCASCHSVDGAAGAGPTFRDLMFSDIELSNGKRHSVDRALVRWVLGGPRPFCDKRFTCQAHDFRGHLHRADVDALVAYVATQSALPDPRSPGMVSE